MSRIGSKMVLYVLLYKDADRTFSAFKLSIWTSSSETNTVKPI